MKSSVATATVVEKPQQQRHAREYEYVNIPALYTALCDAMDRLAKGCSSYSTTAGSRNARQHYMCMIAVLIGLGGTDFSRGLPLVGPYTLWDMVSSNPSCSPLQLHEMYVNGFFICNSQWTHILFA